MLNEFENYLKINIGSKNTRTNYLARVNKFLNMYCEFTQESVNAFLGYCVDNDYKVDTFNGYMNALKHYAKFLKIDIEFPKQKARIKKKKAFLKMSELENDIIPYFKHIFTGDVDLRILVVRLLFTSGLRPDELLNLKKEDIDFKKNWIIVREPKNKRERMTVLVPSLKKEIKDLCERTTSERVFDISERYLAYTFRRLNEMLNYKKHLNPYMCRHGFAHHALKQGIDIKRVKEMMGHSSILITEEYLTLEPDEIIDIAVAKFKYRKGVKK